MNKLNFNNIVPEALGQSQKGQDAFIRYIFDNIGTTNKYCVEFGAADGIENSNTWYLRHNGWDALLLDSCYESNPSINLHQVNITKDNICNIFAAHKVSPEFDFLSIDIDGNDFWILKSIFEGGYRPRVIMVETCVRFNPDDYIAQVYDENWRWNGNSWYGASPGAFKLLAEKFNYTIMNIYLDDAILIRNDLLAESDVNIDFNSIYTKSNCPLYESHGNSTFNSNNWVKFLT
jgi:hypothetical protein